VKPLRSLLLAIAIVVAIVVGQHVGLMHELDHAKAQLSQKDGKPATQACEQCSLCANLTGAPGTQPPTALEPGCVHEPVLAQREDAAQSNPLVNFRSRAPPTLL
jgi:hypothetical protein